MTPATRKRALLACIAMGAVDLVVLNVAVLPALEAEEVPVAEAPKLVSAETETMVSSARPHSSANYLGFAGAAGSVAADTAANLVDVHVASDDSAQPAAELATGKAVEPSHGDVAEPAQAKQAAEPSQPSMDGQAAPTPVVVIEFRKNSPRVHNRAVALLHRTALEFRDVPHLTVIGHADKSGTEAYNDKLSMQRAENVTRHLTRAGISSDHITVLARGSREPGRTGTDRRVEIYVGDEP